MRRPNLRLMAAPPMSTGKLRPRRASSLTIRGICLDVLTSRALRPMASALYSCAFSIMVLAGTCLPRSCTV